MDWEQPLQISNAEFTGYEEEDIEKVTAREREKMRRSQVLPRLKAQVETDLGPGRWEEHWVTVDGSGKRVFAEVYMNELQVVALTAAGDVVRAFGF